MPRNKKVLIIDDEADLGLLLKDYFLKKDHQVFIATTLEEGQLLLSSVQPDIIFLDNNLPDGTGWSVAHEIVASLPDAYLILVSAFHPSVPELPATAKYRVIEKPITLADLNKQFAGF